MLAVRRLNDRALVAIHDVSFETRPGEMLDAAWPEPIGQVKPLPPTNSCSARWPA